MTQVTTNGVITHLEPDILECEVKWALGSITTNKASGGDGIPVELFQILKDDAVKVLPSIFEMLKEKSCQPRIPYLAKLYFKNKGGIKMFLDK